MPEKEGHQVIEKRLSDTLEYLKEKGISSEEIVNLVKDLLKVPEKEEVKVPISVFKNEKLGSLETIVKYLRENKLLAFKQIGSLTNRNDIALAVTYRNAKRKLEAKFIEEISPYYLPVSILKDRKLSVLENIVSYLKDSLKLSYHEIAVMLKRDDRTVWTVYSKVRRKNAD